MEVFWFIVVGVFWTGFFVLEGFDFGVGILHTVVGKTDIEQRVAINTVGPFWDGNEVWLVVAGASIFAAFPGWYATMFSSLYLGVLIVIFALIARGLSFEWRGKSESPRWRRTFSWMMTIGSAVIPLVLGIALGDLVAGLPINSSGDFTGNFGNIFTPYGVWVGLTLLALAVAHGSTFLDLKTTGVVHQRASRLAQILPWGAAVLVVVFAFWTHVIGSGGVLPNIVEVGAILAIVSAAWAARDGHSGLAFASTTVAMACTVGSIFIELYPNVMVSSTDSAFNLTVAGTASSHYALTVMTVVAVVFAPLVLLYQSWNYYVFRERVRGPEAPAPSVDAATAPIEIS
jgi:cytochrome d ubiquinol oxidase subunit II